VATAFVFTKDISKRSQDWREWEGRRWSVSVSTLRSEDAEMKKYSGEREMAAMGEGGDGSSEGRGKPKLTAEEEDELAELMDDSD
jgi:hypothetical protein